MSPSQSFPFILLTLSCACGRTPLDSVYGPPSSDDASSGTVLRDAAPPIGSSGTPDGATPGKPSDGCPSSSHLANGGCVPDDPASALPSTAQCLSGGNVLWIEGDNDAWIYEGTMTVTGGTWKTMPWLNGEPNEGASFIVTPPDAASDDVPWSVYATVYPINGAMVQLGKVYAPTATTSTADAFDVPLLGIQSLNSCEQAEGAFRFDALTDSDDSMTLLSATLSFWLHCHGHRGLLRGCVHYEK